MITLLPEKLRLARDSCAKQAQLISIGTALRKLFWGRKGKHVRHLSDHLARDIGLSPAEMERHRHVWPSQSTDRPNI